MPVPLALFLDEVETPIGAMPVVVDADGILRVADFHDYSERMHKLLARHYGAEGIGFTLTRAPLPTAIRAALDAYFAGDLTAIDALRVATAGTDFQRAVWAALRTIPAGTTISYGALASHIGRPTAVRAVGLANGANPIGIIVPCHRVVGADARLTGYGGGLHRKQWLLEHERAERRLF